MAVEDQNLIDSPLSRTKLKQADHARQKIGERLVALSAEQLERFDLANELREAVALARRTTAHGARNRQVKHIGSLLRRMDTEPIEKALDDIDLVDHEKNLALKKLETWRDQLRKGKMAVVDEILAQCPLAERQHLSQLARNAKKEFDGNKGAKASKALFRYLKAVAAH